MCRFIFSHQCSGVCISSGHRPHHSLQSKEQAQEAGRLCKNMKANKHLVIMMVLFNVYWNPFLTLCKVMYYNPDYFEPRLAHWRNYFLFLSSLNSGINPIIYSACFRPFQMAFKLVFGCIKNGDSPPSISDASDWGRVISTRFTEQPAKAISGQKWGLRLISWVYSFTTVCGDILN